ELTQIAVDAPGYSTFQSHNQKVVQNGQGIFMSYLAKAYDSGQPAAWGDTFLWKIMRSTDGGENFSPIYEDMRMTKAPALETDEEDNVYAFVTDYSPPGYSASSGDALFYRFAVQSGYANPRVSPIPGGAAGKFSAFYDQFRHQFYYFTFNG